MERTDIYLDLIIANPMLLAPIVGFLLAFAFVPKDKKKKNVKTSYKIQVFFYLVYTFEFWQMFLIHINRRRRLGNNLPGYAEQYAFLSDASKIGLP